MIAEPHLSLPGYPEGFAAGGTVRVRAATAQPSRIIGWRQKATPCIYPVDQEEGAPPGGAGSARRRAAAAGAYDRDAQAGSASVRRRRRKGGVARRRGA